MRNIWVISDTHFNHANILNFLDESGNPIRSEFANVQEMNEAMVDRWNEKIKPGDIVYHLGDVFFGDKYDFVENILPKLQGRKRLVVGNHDDIKFLASLNAFQKISMWRKFSEFGLIFTHVPIHMNVDGIVNIHGHIHEKPAPTDKHVNVSVEKINYTPVHIEDFRVT